MKIEEYLETLTGQIRYGNARKPIEEEIRGHLEDQKEACMCDGMSEVEAEEAAVLEMGDPVGTGLSLDQIHRPRMPWHAMILFTFLGLLGLGIQYLTVQVSGGEINGTVNLGRQLLFLLIGFAVMTVVCWFDYGSLVNNASRFYTLLYFLIYYGRGIFGTEVFGAVRWIDIGMAGFKFDTTMLALLFIPLYAALLCSSRGNGYLHLLLDIGMMILPIWLMITCPNVAALLILFGSFSFLLTLAVCKGWFRVSRGRALLLFWGAVLAVLAAVLKLQSKSYGVTRVQRLFGLGEGVSYMVEIIRNVLKGAVWIGEGSYQGEGLLPFSDYMLVYVIAKFGIAAGIAVVLLMGCLILYLYRKSFMQRNECGMMLGVACATTVLAQIFLYVISNLGIISVTGYCPLLTYGGSGTIVTYLLLGILLSVLRMDPVMSLYRTKVPEPKHKKEEEEPVIKIIIVIVVAVAVLAEAAKYN